MTVGCVGTASPDRVATMPDDRVTPLAPGEAMAAIELPAGYRLELVAAEPMVEEPVALAWDGNGRMYVAEMLTYMQDIDGTGQFEPRSRIVRLEDTDGDGRADRRTVFADGLVLPRMILTLEDSILVRETGTLDLWEYRDTDDDGVADDRKMVYRGGERGGNLEHQPSGLDWNIDNYLYVTYTNRRYRYERGAITAHELPDGDGQWGLTHDDAGQLFFSRAGGEVAAASFQQPFHYGKLDLPGQFEEGFEQVWPIDDIPDVQGGPVRLRADNTLNHFTAGCGQAVYRGDRLPRELYGDLFIPEPVGRLIRHAEVELESGTRVLRNPYVESEFLRTRDPNFRPVNTYTAPDGTLYIVDMYRGIIQEGNWVRAGSYLRGVVQEYGLDRNVGRGRIYRLAHRDHERGPCPRMLDQASVELVAHLAHPNGWWRDTAQKLLVLRGDRAAVPALERMAQQTDPLGRLHALWTLDGMHALRDEVLLAAFADADPRVRTAAARLYEELTVDDAGIERALLGLALDRDPGVALQFVRTAIHLELPDYRAMLEMVRTAHPTDAAIDGTVTAHLAALERERIEAERMAAIERANAELAAAMARGKVVYASLCFVCHAEDGNGTVIPGLDLRMAPPLAGSPRVRGAVDRVGRIVLHGLTGPVDGVTYPGAMVAMGSNSDEWVADVLTFVRNSWGNEAGHVTAGDIARVRADGGERLRPWTLEELRVFDPALKSRGLWQLTASHGGEGLALAVDGDRETRWSTGTPMQSGMWLRIELPYAVRVEGVELDSSRSVDDYPRQYEVRISPDGPPIAVGSGSGAEPVIRFEPVETRFLEIRQTGESGENYWSVHELELYGQDHPLPAAK